MHLECTDVLLLESPFWSLCVCIYIYLTGSDLATAQSLFYSTERVKVALVPHGESPCAILRNELSPLLNITGMLVEECMWRGRVWMQKERGGGGLGGWKQINQKAHGSTRHLCTASSQMVTSPQTIWGTTLRSRLATAPSGFNIDEMSTKCTTTVLFLLRTERTGNLINKAKL